MRPQIPHFSWKIPGRGTWQSSDDRVCSNIPPTPTAPARELHVTPTKRQRTRTPARQRPRFPRCPSTAGSNSRAGICLSQFTYSLEEFCISPSPDTTAIGRRRSPRLRTVGFPGVAEKRPAQRFLNIQRQQKERTDTFLLGWGSAGGRSPRRRNSSIPPYSRRNRPPKTSFPHVAFPTLRNYTAEV